MCYFFYFFIFIFLFRYIIDNILLLKRERERDVLERETHGREILFDKSYIRLGESHTHLERAEKSEKLSKRFREKELYKTYISLMV